MSKHKNHCQDISIKSPSFSDFWRTVCDQLGDHRIAINSCAEGKRDLLNAESLHPDFVKELVYACFDRSQKTKKHRVDVSALLDHMGILAHGMRESYSDDLLDIELLEEIAWVINTHFPHCIDGDSLARQFDTRGLLEPSNQLKASTVISIKRYKSKSSTQNSR